VTVRTNRSYRPAKKSGSDGLLTASNPGKHESVGLHSTLEQEIRDYMADPRQARRKLRAGQGSVQGVPTRGAHGCESAARHLTGGIPDIHYLQLADQMLQQGKYKRFFCPKGSLTSWAPIGGLLGVHRHG
jgi:hypothetical protein